MNSFKLDNKVLRFIDDNRIYFMVFIVLIFMMLFAPKFNSLRNYTIILRTASVDSLVAVGFTMVMICKQLDLSIGQLISVGAIVTVGFRVEQFSHLDPAMAWSLGLGCALILGALIGLVNGLLVAKAKINSFIVTLGMMTILQGAINLYSDNAISANTEADFLLSDFLCIPILESIQLITPRTLVSIVFIVIFGLFLTRTKYGKNIYMVGGNSDTAWLAGINTEKYIIGVFILSGVLSALAGALFGMEMCAAKNDLGANSLMLIVSAVIIGGTSMAGGRGGIFKSAIAVLMLTIVASGLNRFGFGNDVKMFTQGLILAVVILYEAYNLYKQEKFKGQRPELLKELESPE